ncbi:hypothetical protein COU76_00715 [Candidatus Peregrinibacteria bacterium CG10_big_fil_rev_8_21_14_0_10_49_10]|nr:MAG: hypothetical protein COU76_00715 [Candidatus Peregrinibacteria bacterium CG10_big_fil_rev_8_21_14_0_10_49_10]
MNEDIHPNWHSTDEEEVPVHAAVHKQEAHTQAPLNTKPVSRKPAAIMGILLVVGITTFFFHGVQDLRGQLSTGSSIRITDKGFSPKAVTAAPGETVTWNNELAVPQYIISDTLCTPADDCLSTATMFQGDSASYTIPGNIPAGEYEYFSPTDPNLVGTITVAGDPIPGTEVSTTPAGAPLAGSKENPIDTFDLMAGNPDENMEVISVAQQSLLNSIRKQLETDNVTGGAQTTASPSTPAPVNLANLPSNPYTVGNTNNFAFDTTGRPPAAPAQLAGSVAPLNGTLGREIQKPFSQPRTGPGLWAVLSLSLFFIWRIARRAPQVYKVA